MRTDRIDPADDRTAALWADELHEGSLSPRRQIALDTWLAHRLDRRRLLERHLCLLGDPALVWAGKRVSQQAARPAPARGWMGRPIFAAFPAGALAVAAGVMLMLAVPRGDLIIGERGAPRSVRLADGSVVRLNGASRVRADLRRDARRLRLDGEGFFEVAADPARPFTVEAGDARVTAVGTRFNVEEHRTPEGVVVEVVVFEGIVDVAPKSGGAIRIGAGRRAQVKNGLVETARLPQPEMETAVPAWTEGWLELEEATLLSVVDDLGRTTGVIVDLEDETMGRALVSGRFAYAQPENALAAIARVHGFTLTRKGPDRNLLSDG